MVSVRGASDTPAAGAWYEAGVAEGASGEWPFEAGETADEGSGVDPEREEVTVNPIVVARKSAGAVTTDPAQCDTQPDTLWAHWKLASS